MIYIDFNQLLSELWRPEGPRKRRPTPIEIRNICISFLVVNMASGMVAGADVPTTESYNMVPIFIWTFHFGLYEALA